MTENIKTKETTDPTYKPQKWIDIKGLYGLNITIDQFDGFKDVVMTIFRVVRDTKKIPFDPNDYIPQNMDINQFDEDTKFMVLAYIKEHFLPSEIKQIREYLSTFPGTIVSEPHLCKMPEDGRIMPTGDIPVGGPYGYYAFYRDKNYPLGDIKIDGYYELCRHKKINPDKPTSYMHILTEVDKSEVCRLAKEGKIKKDEFGIEMIYPTENCNRYVVDIKGDEK